MIRAYDDNQTLQQKLMRGADKLTNNVASTLGPRGRNVLLQEAGQTPFITKDGVTVAAFVSCEDPFENAAAQIIKQAAVETNNAAGDGTTTARTSPIQILPSDVSQVSHGSGHTLFIKTDGSLWGMGGNNRGQLGDANLTDRNKVSIC